MRFYCCVSVSIAEILCPFVSASLTNSKRKITFKLCHKIFHICTVHPAIFKVGNKNFENVSQEFEVI